MFRKFSLAAVVFFGLVRPVAGQQSQPSYPLDAVITADDVYVRSGPGSNYYPTTKLKTGDGVRVLGEQFGWVKIAPPTGSFSYVDMTMVEKAGDKQGKVKVENLRVYAGSGLSARKRELQASLAKDAMVEILGEADGFYKIAPPAGAVLWVSGQFVKRPGDSTPLVKPAPRSVVAAPASQPARVTRNTPPANLPTIPRSDVAMRETTSVASTQPERRTVTVREAGAAPDRWAPFLKGGSFSEQLTKAETDLRTVMAKKDLTVAQLETVRREFEPVAAQTDETVAAAIAKSRVRQIQDRIDILAARDRIAMERKDLDVYRVQLGEDRERILRRDATGDDKAVTFKGLLRISMLFPSSMGRFRLADPADPQSTVAYIDVPMELRSTAKQMLDEVVTVRVASQAFNANLRVPVAVAAEFTAMPKAVAVPASQASVEPDEAVAKQRKPDVDEESEPVSP